MLDNEIQQRKIVKTQQNLKCLFRADDEIFK